MNIYNKIDKIIHSPIQVPYTHLTSVGHCDVARLSKLLAGFGLQTTLLDLECLTVLLEYPNLFQSQWQGTASIWEGLDSARPTPLDIYNSFTRIYTSNLINLLYTVWYAIYTRQTAGGIAKYWCMYAYQTFGSSYNELANLLWLCLCMQDISKENFG